MGPHGCESTDHHLLRHRFRVCDGGLRGRRVTAWAPFAWQAARPPRPGRRLGASRLARDAPGAPLVQVQASRSCDRFGVSLQPSNAQVLHQVALFGRLDVPIRILLQQKAVPYELAAGLLNGLHKARSVAVAFFE